MLKDVSSSGRPPLAVLVPPQLRRVTSPAPTHAEQFDVVIVGMGYVGLPTALSFIGAGRRVCGLDVSLPRIADIQSDDVDLLPVDHDRLRQALTERTLHLSSSPEVLDGAATVIICVPTPVDSHLVPDLTILRAACATTVAHAQPGMNVILTSTTYVGTTRELLVAPLEARGLRVGEDVFVAFSPERIDPGNADFPQTAVPRVVGGVTPACTDRAVLALSAYADHVHAVSSPEAAELTKLFENIFRAVNIALVNEVADLSRDLGVDVMEVIDAASTKPYGFMPFTPGAGVGGHCIPCDPHYLLWQLRRDRRPAPLIEQAMSGISTRPRQVVDRVAELLGEARQTISGAKVLLVGLAYKPGVEDLRESPALEIMERLLAAGAHVQYVDPLVPQARLRDGRVLRSTEAAVDERHDVVVLHTVHPGVDYGWVTRHPLVLDTTYRFSSAPQPARL